MRQTRVHPRILGYLGRALSLELSAVQQYMTQASLVEAWGLPEAAARLREETVEEMRHAELITQRMLSLGAAPNASQLRPAGVGRTLVDLLRQDAILEGEIIAIYQDAFTFCQRVGDGDNGAFFQRLHQEELAHAHDIEHWLASLGVPRRGPDSDRIYF
ncbi:bacterioferritin [Ectothiorhodospira sp. BSL-9]|uniref:ferritin-like domain-containing protein n=1 Tax=Ectothiorhodospira sp. BSL-9 TaxID=1442136 RepID=UPI0007B42764|nr:ferritin-like domain-containing protein [Ectothiorhodospira sp. BSL-9]ANB01508.1 bacterioferritin [Ectothiorhodospira sp. BSL-9]TVQ74040.1 MAG: bacterioferritin [Chromatiaceae bacterium]